MKAVQFFQTVANLVEKVADRPLRDVDAEANVLAYFDSGAAPEDQRAAAEECAETILFEAGYPVEV